MDETTAPAAPAHPRAWGTSACPDNDVHPTQGWADTFDLEEYYRLTWDAAPSDIVQAAEAVTFYAAHPHVRHDSSDLDDFTL